MPTAQPAGDLFAWHRALVGRVSPAALGLALALSRRMDMDGTIPPRFRPGLDRLAADLRFAPSSGRRSVSKLIAELEGAGLLIVERGGGRHVVNGYTAAIPATPELEVAVTETVLPQTRFDGETACPEAANGVLASTHPSPPSQIPSQVHSAAIVVVRDDVGSVARRGRARGPLTAEERVLANAVMHAVFDALPTGDADRLSMSLAALNHRDDMARRIARLVRDGWGDEVHGALVSRAQPWSPSPYAGCADAAASAAARVRELDRATPGKKGVAAGLTP